MAILLVLAITSGVFSSPAVQADPRDQLSTAISHGIKLLEARDYSGFLRDFVSPQEAEWVLGPRGHSDPDLVSAFGKQKAAQVLGALREAQKMSPTYRDNGLIAVYPLKEPVGGRPALAFVKVGKYWYIKN